ncbi:MAG: undecaprenyldiphospho-muramoylpentapeptide beta-N-acetylglucosaminyltransferase [Bacteroidia bacterium]|nr:undecaprenyldiphospho-muramoylpentapeptide beta-N-acetylglucosaminyltransferase [Bacteroidia bacterium]
MKPLKVIFSGGGTGGHIFPAIAIANAVKQLVPQAEILFVGAEGRMEMEKVPAAGFKIEGIPIAGLQRKLSLANFKLPFLIIRSLLKTRSIINAFKPQVVVGTGGYASGPLLRSAVSKNIPVLIQEQNSYAGITNRLLSKHAAKICVAYEGMDVYFPRPKIVITGNPVRPEVIAVEGKRAEALRYFQLEENKKTVLVVGGSLGAKAINESIGQQLSKFTEQDVQVIWQCGKVYYETAKQQAQGFTGKGIYLSEFITRMDLAYAAADVVISRAGAGAISELCLVSKPSILVPLPTAAEDHQTKNAMALVNKQAAVLVKDKECQSHLITECLNLLNKTSRQTELSKNISALAQRDSAMRIAKEVLTLAHYPLV